ncbi:MAG: arsenic efflux protein [Bacteroidales bacterium]|nr:arsenic efflux protein [Bacteroidales bacterium]
MIEIIRNSILITGLVVIMMMMIESLNIESKGLFFKGLRKTKVGQVVIASLLGSIPGCMGGFATVSLYTHRMFSFGALVAMMIASSGDEAFVMLAMIPEQALIIFAVLFVLAIAVGIITDKIYDRVHAKKCGLHDHEECGVHTDCDGFEIHEHEIATSDYCPPRNDVSTSSEDDRYTSLRAKRGNLRHFGWKRISMLVGLALFIAALGTGMLGHDHSAHEGHDHSGHVHTEACEHHAHADHEHGHTIDLLSEDWMNVLFAGLSVIMLVVLIFAKDHFVEEHLWNHIIKKHLPTIFAWTFGVLLVLGVIMHYVNIDNWISDNTALMILLATLIGIIPESGPHMIFVTLFAAGVIPFPVLLASSISQDGHAGIPLLAESKKSFAQAKLINCFVALAAGYAAMLFM